MDRDLAPAGAETRFEASGPVARLLESDPTDPDLPTGRGRSLAGSVLLFLGIGLLALLLIDPGELPVSMPRSWYVDRTLWVAAGLISLAAGWHLLRESETSGGGGGIAAGDRGSGSRRAAATAAGLPLEKLGPGGLRFSRLVLYTRPGCHLCDEAQATLNKYSAFLPPIVAVDIDGDPELVARYSTCVPVVEFDGKVRFRGRVNEVLLRRLIAGTPPRDTTRTADDL
jgi:glutaredoxin